MMEKMANSCLFISWSAEFLSRKLCPPCRLVSARPGIEKKSLVTVIVYENSGPISAGTSL
jgi:hypothetical protein